ncbi:hypothetical protein AB6A40_010706 [Gnathostoma spinigerum]|uniref:Uncharacterized protein n=1 Tax=Gnathostoma spinigerum TaxID=75299 RepID=A0ABD6EY27_9BILA
MSTASHMSAMGHQRTSQSSSLSYADTSIMSYPSPESRVTVSKGAAITTLHHQQQQQAHQLYTTTQIPYNSYGYLNMNMYSPVASVRQDDAQYAAALLQYPFGMGQIDMSSLSTVLPPPALASQGQPNQPPPPIQNQHQQRPDQHTSYVDFKAYAAATGVASNTAGGVTGASLLGSQQGRETSAMGNSTVAPPPGFSGPPSNMPATAFTLPQPNHMSSIFPVPPTYPQLNQLPLSFMLPHVAGNSQHKIGQHIFQQQAMDESSLPDQRHSAQQQKVSTF